MTAEEQLFNKYGKLFKKGEYLFHDNDLGNEMFVLQEGEVEVLKKIGGQEKVLAVLKKGDFFGEMAILNGKPRTATIRVSVDSKILVINPSTFESMIRGNADIAIKMLQKLATRLAQADLQIENLLLVNPESRVVHYIKEKVLDIIKENENEVELTIIVSDVSSSIMIDPLIIKKVLTKLVRNELIVQVNGPIFKIPDFKVFSEFFDYLTKKEKFKEFN
jgi:CRP-like cAMP-binding protein